jgi:hypothetical protein
LNESVIKILQQPALEEHLRIWFKDRKKKILAQKNKIDREE